MEWVAIVTVLALAEYIWLSVRVGRARGEFEVRAPAVTGHPTFERHFRVHQNTLEQLVLFLPSLWLSAALVGQGFAAGVGVLFVVGRVLYANAYVRDPEKRGPGMLLGFVASAVLLVSAFVGAIARLF